MSKSPSLTIPQNYNRNAQLWHPQPHGIPMLFISWCGSVVPPGPFAAIPRTQSKRKPVIWWNCCEMSLRSTCGANLGIARRCMECPDPDSLRNLQSEVNKSDLLMPSWLQGGSASWGPFWWGELFGGDWSDWTEVQGHSWIWKLWRRVLPDAILCFWKLWNPVSLFARCSYIKVASSYHICVYI